MQNGEVRVWNTEAANEVERKGQPLTSGHKRVKVGITNTSMYDITSWLYIITQLCTHSAADVGICSHQLPSQDHISYS